MKLKNKNLSLSRLERVIYSEVDLGDFYLPLKIDLKDIQEEDYAIAIITMDYLKKKSNIVRSDKKERIKCTSVNFDDKGNISFNITPLHYQHTLESIYDDEMIIRLGKFINTQDKLFILKGEKVNFLEYFNIDSFFDFVKQTKMPKSIFLKIQRSICYWIEVLVLDFREKIKEVLEINDKESMNYNQPLLELQITYEHIGSCYYEENMNKPPSQWSLREKDLSQSYFTKKTMIDNAIEKYKADILKKTNSKPSHTGR